MRKLPLYAMTALAAMTMTGTMAMTSQAAVLTYVVGGSGSYGCDYGNGQVIGWGNMRPDGNGPQIVFPDFNVPNMPDNNMPVFPDMELPVLPDGGNSQLPDIGVPSQPDQNGSVSAYAAKVVELVNAERAKAGLQPVNANSRMMGAAEVRAREIERSFSHTRPDGSGFSTVLTQNGVSFRGSGENIAYGQPTPEAVMETWMNSAGHRGNILNGQFTDIGVGYYENGSGVGYWVQVFTY